MFRTICNEERRARDCCWQRRWWVSAEAQIAPPRAPAYGLLHRADCSRSSAGTLQSSTSRLDDYSSEPGVFVLMRFINHGRERRREVAGSVNLRPGSAPQRLNYRGAGLFPGAGRDVRTGDQHQFQRPADRRDARWHCVDTVLRCGRRRRRTTHRPPVGPLNLEGPDRSHRFEGSGANGSRKRVSTRRIVLALTSALTLSCRLASAPRRAGSVRQVPGAFAQQPDDYESAYCFYQITIDERRWDEGDAGHSRI